MDTSRLVKLLRLSSSDQDGEALSAIRKANALLRTAGIDWADILVTSSAPGNVSLSLTAVVIDGHQHRPPLGTWSETADFLVSRATAMGFDRYAIEVLHGIGIRLRKGGDPAENDARLIISLYRMAGGVTR